MSLLRHHQLLLGGKRQSTFMIAAHGSTPRITMWETATWTKLANIISGSGTAGSVTVSLDNRYIIYTLDGSNPRLRVYDRQTSTEVAAINLPGDCNNIVPVKNGAGYFLVGGGAQRVNYLERGTWVLSAAQSPTATARDAAYRRITNRTYVAHNVWRETSHPTGADCNVSVYDTDTLQVVDGYVTDDLSAHGLAVAVSPGQNYLAIQHTGSNPGFKVYYLPTGALVFSDSYTPAGNAVRFSPDGRFLARSRGLEVDILDAQTYATLQTFTDAPSTISEVSWSQDSQYFAYGSLGTSAPRVWVRNVSDWSLRTETALTLPGACNNIKFSYT